MIKRLFSLMAALLFVAGAVPFTAQAELADLGISIAPHGYPAFYEDANGLQLELCVPPPAGNSSRPDLCIFDPLELDEEGNPINPLVLTGEGFYWMASTSIPMPGGGDASIEFAIESTFGGAEEPINGQQITFGRTRIRIDTPVAGTYTVTHPYGIDIFEVAVGEEEDGINMTSDIGSANFLFPELAFRGTLTGPIGPFLTWPDYQNESTLWVTEPVLDGEGNPVLDAEGNPVTDVVERYVGDPNIASPVVGSPTGNNFFRVQGPVFNGEPIDLQIDEFFVMGKIFDSTATLVAHTWPDAPAPNLFAVGPVNREVFFAIPSIGSLAETYSENYSLGYPLWYQEALAVLDELGNPVLDPITEEPLREGGLQLTLCTPGDAMCISEPINLADPDHQALFTGGEGFWFHAAASFDDGDDSYSVEFALESTFGGDESMVDGNQISFARERIRFDFDADKPVATYRVIHPYGQRILEGDPDRLDRVRFVADIGIADLADPDGAFVGALYGAIGPTFLTWDNFVNPATLPADQLGPNYPVQDLVTVHDEEAGLYNYHIGNPNVPHAVVGGPNGNIFRVERLVSGTVEDGEWELIGETAEFTVSGKIYDPQTFEFNINPLAPVAIDDAATLDTALADSVTIAILANDTFTDGAPIDITVLPAGEAFGPESGTVSVNPDGTVTYTPNAEFAAAGGVDTFAYTIVDSTGLASNTAVVTVTILPEETITIDRARFNTRNLRLELRGTSNFPGRTLTIRAGTSVAGDVIGTVAVDDRGRWTFRGTATSNLTDVTVVSNSAEATTVTQALQVR